MATAAPKRMTLAEFLDWDDGTDTHYELVHGRVVAMAPASPAHGRIVGNLAVEIGSRLKPPCAIVGQAGIVPPGRDGAYYEADLAVTCTPEPPGTRHIVEPVLIVEILLVSSTERTVELWRRDGPRWAVECFVGEAELRLETIDATIPLAAVYADVAAAF